MSAFLPDLIRLDGELSPLRRVLELLRAAGGRPCFVGGCVRNALLGLFMVLLVTWLFLGGRIAVLTTIGIPCALHIAMDRSSCREQPSGKIIPSRITPLRFQAR